jgi:hypothetical protein
MADDEESTPSQNEVAKPTSFLKPSLQHSRDDGVDTMLARRQLQESDDGED